MKLSLRIIAFVLHILSCNAFRFNLGLPKIVTSAINAKTYDVFIGNIEFSATKQDVENAVLKKVLGHENFYLPLYNETCNRGYGFFRFQHTKFATAALKVLENLSINNRTVKVSLPATNTVTFNNLDPSINANILKKICDDTIALNAIQKVELPMHPKSGMALGYAIITFNSEELAQKAVKTLHGIHLLNRPLVLSFAPAKYTPEDALPDEEPAAATTAPVYTKRRTSTAVEANSVNSTTLNSPSVNYNSPHTLFVHNIRKTCTEKRFEKEIMAVLGGKVDVVGWRLCMDKNNRFRGYGFVMFKSDEDMHAALPLLNSAFILDRFIMAAPANKQQSDEAAAAGGDRKVWSKKVPSGPPSASASASASASVTASSSNGKDALETIAEDLGTVSDDDTDHSTGSKWSDKEETVEESNGSEDRESCSSDGDSVPTVSDDSFVDAASDVADTNTDTDADSVVAVEPPVKSKKKRATATATAATTSRKRRKKAVIDADDGSDDDSDSSAEFSAADGSDE